MCVCVPHNSTTQNVSPAHFEVSEITVSHVMLAHSYSCNFVLYDNCLTL